MCCRPDDPPLPGLWKGVLDSGKTGYFDSSHTAPFIEIKTTSPVHTAHAKHKAKISRKGRLCGEICTTVAWSWIGVMINPGKMYPGECMESHYL